LNIDDIEDNDMLRARLSNGAFLLGIDAENVRRLKDGEPILVSLAELGGTDDVVILFGETVADIIRELETITGQRLPEPTSLKKIRNPQ
jgi:hypothetical protein